MPYGPRTLQVPPGALSAFANHSGLPVPMRSHASKLLRISSILTPGSRTLRSDMETATPYRQERLLANIQIRNPLLTALYPRSVIRDNSY